MYTMVTYSRHLKPFLLGSIIIAPVGQLEPSRMYA